MKPVPYGTFLLDAIVSATGGLSITVDRLKTLDDAMNTMGLALHNQYLIGYYPPHQPGGGKWRKVQVKVIPDEGRQRLRAYTRSGYFGPEWVQFTVEYSIPMGGTDYAYDPLG